MLLQAMNSYILASRDHKEAMKGQYNDKAGTDGAKTYFRASELGDADRKIIYGFFKHQLPVIPRTANSLRKLVNGDYVHKRYQEAWEEMGVLIAMEERLSSKDDEYLQQFPWEWAGHHDGELDMNILRAHALGKCTLETVKNEETGVYEIQVNLDDAYAAEIGIFDENYQPVTMIGDIKSMSQWGFKRIRDKKDISEIQGYIDQIMFYMYMKNTPYGSIFIEEKDTNSLVEVQIVWKDLHDGVVYGFTPELHGEQDYASQIRLVVDMERFAGSETQEGSVQRIDRLYKTIETIRKIDAGEIGNNIADVMPARCSDNASKFPCSWSDGREKCGYFDHCWNQEHNGYAVRPYEACPPDKIWDIFDYEDDAGQHFLKVDSRKVPAGVSQEAFATLVSMKALDVSQFLIESQPVPIREAMQTATDAEADKMFGAGGELMLGTPSAASGSGATEAVKYKIDSGDWAIKCTNCAREVTFKRVVGGVKPCPFCNHENRIASGEAAK